MSDPNQSYFTNAKILGRVWEEFGLSNGSITDQYFWKFERYFFHYVGSNYPNPCYFRYYVRDGVIETTLNAYHYLWSDVEQALASSGYTGTQLRDASTYTLNSTQSLSADNTWHTLNITTELSNNYLDSLNVGAINVDDHLISIIKASNSISPSGTTIVSGIFDSLGICDTSNCYDSIIDKINDGYPPYIEYTYNYPYMSNDITGLSIQPSAQMMGIYTSVGVKYYKQVFFKFDLPAINGKIEYAYMNMNVDYAVDSNKFISLKTYSTCSVDWSSTSDTSTMDNVYNTSKYHLENRDLGLNSSDDYLINAFGFYYIDTEFGVLPTDSSETADLKRYLNDYRTSVEGIRWAYDNTANSITMILETPITDSSVNSYTSDISGNLFLGTSSGIVNSIKQIPGVDSSNGGPTLFISYIQPEIDITPSSFTRYLSAGTNITDNSFTVTNIGYGTLKPTVSDSLNWLSVRYDISGSFTFDSSEGMSYYSDPNNLLDASNGDSIDYIIEYNTSGLTTGIHDGTIYLQDNDAKIISVPLTVRLYIASNSYVVTNTNLMTIRTPHNNILDNTSFQVWDGSETASDTLNYYLETPTSWVLNIPDSSTTFTSTGSTDKNTHIINFDTSSLEPGDYTGYIYAINSNDTSNFQEIVIDLKIINKGSQPGMYNNYIF